ncbi:putative pollen-specific leucine-rich repeat extensin-like protein 3 [Iris pallida]|uniref:Pollen-specific leucine-rich repeat extensin-like protein 3 n=1 Tax=Iris pallida TaxID=29817 RepID=A0AAX6EVH0_IRIPA|nr:putative pollen-specific leucine-rich repeat extensin-like protein 3 [Iris pallida]
MPPGRPLGHSRPVPPPVHQNRHPVHKHHHQHYQPPPTLRRTPAKLTSPQVATIREIERKRDPYPTRHHHRPTAQFHALALASVVPPREPLSLRSSCDPAPDPPSKPQPHQDHQIWRPDQIRTPGFSRSS